jgi:hypothetical protein|tara:strand:- start:622 stop:771 length:150 start_codon:yes stop_codon:yes gene_type:complete
MGDATEFGVFGERRRGVDATRGVVEPRARAVFASTHRSMIDRERASSHS